MISLKKIPSAWRISGIACSFLLLEALAFGEPKGKAIKFSTPIGYPLLPDVFCKLGEAKAWCQIDTGASTTVVDPILQPLLSPTGESISIGDASGESILMNLFRIPPLTVQSFKVPIEKVLVHDLSRFFLLTGMDHTIIMGCDALRTGTLVCDFDKDLMFFQEEAGKFNPDTWLGFDLTFEHNTPFVRHRMGDNEIAFMIDTGSTGSIDLLPTFYKSLVESGAIEEMKPVQSVTGSGVSESSSGVFTKGELFGRPLNGVEVSVTEFRNKLGMEFLSSFNFAIDFPNARFYADYREDFVMPNIARVLGLMLIYPERKVTVYKVRPASDERNPAASAGLVEGDRLLRFGPLTEENINVETIYQYLQAHPHGDISIEVIREPTKQVIKQTLSIGLQ